MGGVDAPDAVLRGGDRVYVCSWIEARFFRLAVETGCGYSWYECISAAAEEGVSGVGDGWVGFRYRRSAGEGGSGVGAGRRSSVSSGLKEKMARVRKSSSRKVVGVAKLETVWAADLRTRREAVRLDRKEEDVLDWREGRLGLDKGGVVGRMRTAAGGGSSISRVLVCKRGWSRPQSSETESIRLRRSGVDFLAAAFGVSGVLTDIEVDESSSRSSEGIDSVDIDRVNEAAWLPTKMSSSLSSSRGLTRTSKEGEFLKLPDSTPSSREVISSCSDLLNSWTWLTGGSLCDFLAPGRVVDRH